MTGAPDGELSLTITPVPYDHPDAAELIAQVQLEYARLYGTPDASPADPGQFVPPAGLFGLGYAGGVPVAMGGWRSHGDGRAEIRRMYVPVARRGLGLARRMLTWIEDTARTAGHTSLILETGLPLPAAIALYRSSGYAEVEAFGYYADSEQSVFLGKRLR